MPRPKDTIPAGAPAPSNGAALAPVQTTDRDELAAYGVDADVDDGLGGVGAGDIRLANLQINAKKLDKNGRQVPADQLYNTLDETVRAEVNAVFLLRRKSNEYSIYHEAEKVYERKCSSRDQVTGTMADGTQRPCRGCPDAAWFTSDQGKRKKNCAEVHRVIGVDRESLQLFSMRFQKSSARVIEQHLAKHHIGRRIAGGKRLNYPLYTFALKISARMAGPKTSHALPVIEHAGVLGREEFELCKSSSEAVASQIDQVLDQAEANEQKSGDVGGSDADDSGGGDTSFDAAAYGGGEGQDFVASSGGKA